MTISNQLLTDIASAISTGPTTTSQANAIAAAGPVIDLLGMLVQLQTRFKEDKQMLTQVIAVLDGGDGIKATIQNIKNAFV